MWTGNILRTYNDCNTEVKHQFFWWDYVLQAMVFENWMQFIFKRFSPLGLLFVWVFNLFIIFINSLDSRPVIKKRVLSREHTHGPTMAGSAKRHRNNRDWVFKNSVMVSNFETYFPDSQVKEVAINKNQKLLQKNQHFSPTKAKSPY